MSTRDTDSENYAAANSYDVSDRASDYTEEVAEGDEVERPLLEDEAGRLFEVLGNLERARAHAKALIGRPVFAYCTDQLEERVAEYNLRIPAVEAKLAAALKREREEWW